MKKIAFQIKKEQGDGCTAAFFCNIIKAAGYRSACLVAEGKEREHLLVSGRPLSKKQWETLGENPEQASLTEKLQLLESQNPEFLLWIGTEEIQRLILQEEQEWLCIREETLTYSLEKVWHGVRKQRFHFEKDGEKIKDMELEQPGDWQVENAGRAMALVFAIASQCPEITVTEKAIRKGILSTHSEGCLETLENRPLILTDRASSMTSARLLWESAGRMLGNRPVIGILGLEQKEEKDVQAFLQTLCPEMQMLLTVSVPGGYSAYELAEQAKEVQENVTAVDSPEEALEIARLFAMGQTATAEMPAILLVCPRILQEKFRKIISQRKKPRS